MRLKKKAIEALIEINRYGSCKPEDAEPGHEEQWSSLRRKKYIRFDSNMQAHITSEGSKYLEQRDARSRTTY